MIQRVSRASVSVADEVVGSIGPGLLVFAGVTAGDTDADVDALADKVALLRIFPDDGGLMNRSVADAGGAVLVVSQFTLYASVSRGRRPSFTAAARPEHAEPLVSALCRRLREHGLQVSEGRFGAMMEVELVNDGPVTILVETSDGRVV